MSLLNDDLVLYLKLDGTEGYGTTTILDSSRSKMHGIIVGDAIWVADPTFGTCLGFNGGCYLTIPSSETCSIGAYTVEVWMNPAQPDAEWQGVIGKPGRNFNIWLNKQGYISQRFNAPVENMSDGAPDTAPGSIKWEAWNHVAITYDGKMATTYINGIEVAKGALGSQLVHRYPLFIGREIYGNTCFKGKLAQVRVYKRALSVTEIGQNMETAQAELVAHFALDEMAEDGNVANTVPGVSGLAHAASLVPDDTFGAALQFDGAAARVTVEPSAFASVTNTFTLSGWVIPTATHQINPQATTGTAGTSGQRFMIFPTHGVEAYGEDHAGVGISVGTNGISVYEHSANYLPPLLVWEKPGSDPALTNVWTHIALVYTNKQPSLYVNGKCVAQGLTSPKAFIHPSATIGGGRYGYFPGKIAQVRVYRRALSESDIQQVMQADQMALPAYRKGHPIDFSLLDENQNYVLYISDDPKASHTLTLALRNTSTQAIQFQPGAGSQASPQNYHFELVFRHGVLSVKTLQMLRANTASVLQDPEQWDVAVDPAQLGEAIEQSRRDVKRPSGAGAAQTLALYVLYKGSDRVFTPSQLRVVGLQNVSAAAGSGMRGTQVELRLHQLVYVDDANSPTPSPITGTRVQQLQITNQSGKQFIPLHVGFVGGNRLLNDGSPNPYPLRLRITNTAKEALSLEGGQLTLVFDVGDEWAEWAIATPTFRPVITVQYPNGTSAELHEVTHHLSGFPEWTIDKQTSLIPELQSHQQIEVSIAGITTTHPTGFTNLYVKYNIPGYWEGQFVCVIEKAPLLFYDVKDANGAYTKERRVGIGNPTPQNLLHVGAGTSTIAHARVNTVIATQTEDAGIAIAQKDQVNVLLQASTAGGYIGTVSDHPLVLRTKNHDRLAIDRDGNVVIVGTVTTQKKFVGEGALVTGMILMWSGKSTAIPSGWALCDGKNGTPDLRKRFILGTDEDFKDVTDSDRFGGQELHTHSMDEAGEHRHDLTTRGGSIPRVMYADDRGDAINPGGKHTHALKPASTLPPYYKLVFIMKL